MRSNRGSLVKGGSRGTRVEDSFLPNNFPFNSTIYHSFPFILLYLCAKVNPFLHWLYVQDKILTKYYCYSGKNVVY